MDHYETLEVSANASPAVIKAAYKSLMQRYHPDKNNNDSASAQRSTQIAQAYEVLSDEVRRAGYDQQIQSQAALRPAARDVFANTRAKTAYAPMHPAQNSQGYWVVWLLIICTIVLALWFLLSKSKPTSLEQSPALSAAGADGQDNRPLAGYRLTMLDISATLLETDKLPPGLVKMVKIPVLGLSITHPDARRLFWHLDDRKQQLRHAIETKLTYTGTDQVVSGAGPKYLKELVGQVVFEMAAAHSPELGNEARNIEIDLPKAFSADLYAPARLPITLEK